MVTPLVKQLAALNPDFILHSDLLRTRLIAEPLARRLGIACMANPLWRERHFGIWEGQSWHAIYRATGNAMDRFLDDPDHFRPDGGETTRALAARIERAINELPKAGSIAIITHGGPIACAVASRNGAALKELASFIPAAGSITTL